jgi:hypothetical protein
MLRTCRAPGCTTLTLGTLCISHEPAVDPRTFPRGRPYRLKDREVLFTPELLLSAGKEHATGVVLLEGAG